MSIPFTKSLIFRILWNNQHGLCFYCQSKLKKVPYDKKKSPKGCTRDHFFPACNGHIGTGNSIISCFRCNNSKAKYPPTYLECVRFYELWAVIQHPDSRVRLDGFIWDEFAEDMRIIRTFSRLVGLSCP